MRISRLLLLGAAVALGGCESGVTVIAPNRATVDIAGEPVAIAAPSGFCIDQAATSTEPSGAFVLITDCGLLGAPGGSTPPIGAMMTASISAAPASASQGDETTLDDLEAFLSTPRGLAGLGRSGDAGATRIAQSSRQGDVLYVLVEDRGPSPLPNVEARFWRAFTSIGGRMAALSIQGFDGASPGLQAELRHLAAFAAILRAANPQT